MDQALDSHRIMELWVALAKDHARSPEPTGVSSRQIIEGAPLVIYFGGRILHPPCSGGIFGYFLGLVSSLARNPRDSIHVGVTPLNFRQINSVLENNVGRNHIRGSENSAWATSERRIIEKIDLDWVVYSYPGAFNIYDEGRSFKVAACIPDLHTLPIRIS